MMPVPSAVHRALHGSGVGLALLATAAEGHESSGDNVDGEFVYTLGLGFTL